MTTKTEAAKQKAFEDGADYAVTYIENLLSSLASALDDTDDASAGLLRYVSAKAREYNCGDYPDES